MNEVLGDQRDDFDSSEFLESDDGPVVVLPESSAVEIDSIDEQPSKSAKSAKVEKTETEIRDVDTEAEPNFQNQQPEDDAECNGKIIFKKRKATGQTQEKVVKTHKAVKKSLLSFDEDGEN